MPYPRDGDIDILRVDADYVIDAEDTRKFLLKTTERTISIFESQIDAIVGLSKQATGKTFKVYWEQSPNSKSVFPVTPAEE